MRDSGIRCLRNVQRQPDGTYIVDIELDIGIIIQGVTVRGNVSEAPVHMVERTEVVSHPTYRSTYRRKVPEPTFVYLSPAAKERIGAVISVLISRQVGETSTPRLFEDVGGEE
jgi:hypothetical protein